MVKEPFSLILEICGPIEKMHSKHLQLSQKRLIDCKLFVTNWLPFATRCLITVLITHVTCNPTSPQ